MRQRPSAAGTPLAASTRFTVIPFRLFGSIWDPRAPQDWSAATPGRVLPSIHSRNAPPAVET